MGQSEMWLEQRWSNNYQGKHKELGKKTTQLSLFVPQIPLELSDIEPGSIKWEGRV